MTVDIGATISRAFDIVKRHRALWILGFLAALGGVGGGGGNFNLPSGGNFGVPSGNGGSLDLPSNNPFEQFNRIFSPENWQLIGGVVLAVCCIGIVIGIVLWLVGLAANGGLISGANRAEMGESFSFGEVWRSGTARLKSFIGMRILLIIPNILVSAIVAVAVVIAIVGAGGLAALSDSAQSDSGAGIFAIFSGVACIIIPLICVLSIYSIIAGGIQMLGDRAIMIDQVGAMDAIRQGWALFRSNLGNIIIMGIILAIIGAIVGFIAVLVGGIVLAPSIVLMVTQSSSQSGPQALSFVVLGVSILAFIIIVAIISSVVVAFRATVWTLIYRQISGKGMALPPASSAPPAPLPVQ